MGAQQVHLASAVPSLAFAAVVPQACALCHTLFCPGHSRPHRERKAGKSELWRSDRARANIVAKQLCLPLLVLSRPRTVRRGRMPTPWPGLGFPWIEHRRGGQLRRSTRDSWNALRWCIILPHRGLRRLSGAFGFECDREAGQIGDGQVERRRSWGVRW